MGNRFELRLLFFRLLQSSARRLALCARMVQRARSAIEKLAYVVGVIGEGEGEQGRQEKNEGVPRRLFNKYSTRACWI